MPVEPQLWMKRVKGVEREFLASRLAVDRINESVHDDPTILGNNVQVRDVQQADANLEGTYIIRIFAEFETGLRKFWNRNRPDEHNRKTPAEVLVNNIAAEVHVSSDTLREVHNARNLRNNLVHETEAEMEKIQIGQIRSSLCTYLYNLYPVWR